jgi:hypothetical protein
LKPRTSIAYRIDAFSARRAARGALVLPGDRLSFGITSLVRRVLDLDPAALAGLYVLAWFLATTPSKPSSQTAAKIGDDPQPARRRAFGVAVPEPRVSGCR